jgi:hypothetical protein
LAFLFKLLRFLEYLNSDGFRSLSDWLGILAFWVDVDPYYYPVFYFMLVAYGFIIWYTLDNMVGNKELNEWLDAQKEDQDTAPESTDEPSEKEKE